MHALHPMTSVLGTACHSTRSCLSGPGKEQRVREKQKATYRNPIVKCSLTKVNSKYVKDLTVRPQAIKLLEENIEKKLLHTDLGKDFLNKTQKAQATKTKVNK